MDIRTARRISQVFFLALFLWFCLVMTVGAAFHQLRGWPVNWFLQLDPLAALGTLLTTGTVYRAMAWALLTLALTVALGRFFCGWLCPFGALHQFIGYLGHRRKKALDRAGVNQPHPAQSIKYYILIFMLTTAAMGGLHRLIQAPFTHDALFRWTIIGVAAVIGIAAALGRGAHARRWIGAAAIVFAGWSVLGFLFRIDMPAVASLQTGLLDPIPLIHRSVNLILLPLADATALPVSRTARYYDGALLIGLIFGGALVANLWVPRFYCRFICPLGALFGLFSRFSLFRIGQKTEGKCVRCHLCEANCEGACAPSGQIRVHECVLCLNCMDACRAGRITYSPAPSAGGESLTPDLTRRGLIVSLASAAVVIPTARISGYLDAGWSPALIRPPGALAEADLLARCLKCGQCMRVCPTNVIHPAAFQAGIEGLWTPTIDFRLGTSGCQKNCIACGNICPTAAIRPITLDERLGVGPFAESGPIRIGTAFVDRGRCLPWAMRRPCIVCQENCPVSPKAIVTETAYETAHIGKVAAIDSGEVTLEMPDMPADAFATGDHYLSIEGRPERHLIMGNTTGTIRLAAPIGASASSGARAAVQIRLQRPVVDPALCIGCGVCEHECPVRGKRAIRVTAEGESRHRGHAMLPG